MSDLLDQIIAKYRSQHGEPEYRYFKKLVVWTKFRREPGYHCTPIGDGTEISKEEYEANIADSARFCTEAFMGRLPQSYWKYDRKMVKDGWREILVKDIHSHNGQSGKGK